MHWTHLSQQRAFNKDNDVIKMGGMTNSHWHRRTQQSVSIFSLHMSSALCAPFGDKYVQSEHVYILRWLGFSKAIKIK